MILQFPRSNDEAVASNDPQANGAADEPLDIPAQYRGVSRDGKQSHVDGRIGATKRR